MPSLETIADIIMCCSWVAVYILVLISTCKTRIPAMGPVACLLIVPWELVATLKDILAGAAWDYVFLSHMAFCIADFAVILTIIFGLRYYTKRQTIFYFAALTLICAALWFVFEVPNGKMYTSYINTTAGVICWLIYIMKPGYPLTKLNYGIAMLKLFADLLCIITYSSFGTFVLLACIILPLIDTVHILHLARAMERTQKNEELV